MNDGIDRIPNNVRQEIADARCVELACVKVRMVHDHAIRLRIFPMVVFSFPLTSELEALTQLVEHSQIPHGDGHSQTANYLLLALSFSPPQIGTVRATVGSFVVELMKTTDKTGRGDGSAEVFSGEILVLAVEVMPIRIVLPNAF